MSGRVPEPADGLAAEGIPDHLGGLDAKKATGDAQEGIVPPHDYPVAVDEYGTTAAEQRDGEPLDLRLSREEPEDDGGADLSEGADQPFDRRAGQGVGRLVEPDEGARTDTEPDLVAADEGTDGGGFSAEESAMHISPEIITTDEPGAS